MTKSQLDITNKSQEVSPFPAGDPKAAMKTDAKAWHAQDINNTNDPQKKYRLGMLSKNTMIFKISKFNIGLKSLLLQWLSEPEFYDELVYKLKKIVGVDNFHCSLLN